MVKQQEKQEYRAVFISDTHLGTSRCKDKELLAFLKSFKTERLYLVGDIIDGWALERKHYWNTTQTEILRRILKISETTEVVYIPGNHDKFIRPFFKYNFSFGNFIIEDYVLHKALDGRTVYVTHGDKHDYLMHIPKPVINFFARFTDFEVFAEKRQQTKKRYLRTTATESAVKRYCRLKGYDTALTGHTHYPKIEDNFMNDGDWVKHCTYIVETKTGEWELKYYEG